MLRLIQNPKSDGGTEMYFKLDAKKPEYSIRFITPRYAADLAEVLLRFSRGEAHRVSLAVVR